MSTRRKTLSMAAAALVLLLAMSTAACDSFPYLKFKTPAVCETEGGSNVRLPPGRFIPEPGWLKLDESWRDMEDDRTRLLAENKALKESDSPVGWKTATAAVVVGILLGRYALDR